MEIEALVQRITREVLKRLERSSLEALMVKSGAYAKRTAVLLIAPCHTGSLEGFFTVISGRHKESDMILAREGGILNVKAGFGGIVKALDIGSQTLRQEIMDGFDGYEAVYCLAPGIKLLENIVNGNDAGFIESVVIKGLLNLKDVNIMLDFDIESLPVNNFAKRVKGLLNSVRDMGILVETIASRKEAKICSSQAGKKELITGKDVDEMSRSGMKEIFTGSGTLITPLAKDRAKELGMRIAQL